MKNIFKRLAWCALVIVSFGIGIAVTGDWMTLGTLGALLLAGCIFDDGILDF